MKADEMAGSASQIRPRQQLILLAVQCIVVIIVKSNNSTFNNIFIVIFVKASYFHVTCWVTDLKMEIRKSFEWIWVIQCAKKHCLSHHPKVLKDKVHKQNRTATMRTVKKRRFTKLGKPHKKWTVAEIGALSAIMHRHTRKCCTCWSANECGANGSFSGCVEGPIQGCHCRHSEVRAGLPNSHL